MTDHNASVTVTDRTREALRGTKGWVKLVGVLFLIAAAFTVLAMLLVIFGMGAVGGAKQGAMPLVMVVLMCGLYLVMVAVYFFLGTYLLNYSKAIVRLLGDEQVATLEIALQAQQKFWKLAGIMALIMLAISLIGIVAAIAIPMMASR